MKTALEDACRKCGGQVWYVYKSGRCCVACAHARAMTARAEIRRLQAAIAEVTAERNELQAVLCRAYDCLPDMPAVCCQTVQIAAEAIRARGDA